MARDARVPGDGFRLPAPVVTAMQSDLQHVAEKVVTAVIGEVPSYSEPFRGRMGRTIETAVAMALGGFLELASSAEGIGPGTRVESVESVFEAAYGLGRGEARSGRSMDALASAYRVGARTAWRDMSAIAVDTGLPAADLARFAELVFDYIDQLSAASVSGHADELATSGRVRQRYLDRLAANILAGHPAEGLAAAAERAEWLPPRTLTAVILPESSVGPARSQLDPRTLQPTEESPGLEGGPELAVLLVPDAGGRSRSALLRTLQGRGAVVGPARPWLKAKASYDRALRARALGLVAEGETVDTEEHLATIVLRSDREALADLQTRALAPLADLRPATAEKLRDTLRFWLLHQGRRDDVAAALFVHPQTVRYRMGQLRELYGDRLEDPTTVLELTIALGGPTGQRPG